ncbi:hypothetical protein BDZ97DRAFT_1863382 [Flammula alnicola]|nr:hypothetical protein BDZ97DRAFT_1863382 [Flammula alnicola]
MLISSPILSADRSASIPEELGGTRSWRSQRSQQLRIRHGSKLGSRVGDSVYPYSISLPCFSPTRPPDFLL